MKACVKDSFHGARRCHLTILAALCLALVGLFGLQGHAAPTNDDPNSAADLEWFQFNDARYLFVTDQLKSWHDAQDYCLENHGSFLASITTAKEQKFISQTIISKLRSGAMKVKQDFWLGGYKEEEQSGPFRWTDDSQFTYSNWNSEFLTNFGPLNRTVENDVCVELRKNYQWDAREPCSTPRHFICKYFTATDTSQYRKYFIQSEEVEWDYAPDGLNALRGDDFNEEELVFVGQEDDQIGSKYVKCLFFGYTDGSFQTRLPETQESRELGFLGPTIRAVVGEKIRIVFRNKCSFPTTMHPHGVKYDKFSEGAGYADDVDGDPDDAVTNTQQIYVWDVPERAGPGPMDPSSVMWMYHSHFDEIGDTYAGLNGFMVITAKGKAKADATPVDVDHEVFSLFMVVNEQLSSCFEDSLKKFAPNRQDAEDQAEWEESDLMHSINGYVYGNGPMVTLTEGTRTRWYLMGMGTEVDLHTPHWHGNTVLHQGMRMDVVNLLPASMVTADMTVDNPGIWLFHCHVNDHIAAGMITRYEVVKA